MDTVVVVVVVAVILVIHQVNRIVEVVAAGTLTVVLINNGVVQTIGHKTHLIKNTRDHNRFNRNGIERNHRNLDGTVPNKTEIDTTTDKTEIMTDRIKILEAGVNQGVTTTTVCVIQALASLTLIPPTDALVLLTVAAPTVAGVGAEAGVEVGVEAEAEAQAEAAATAVETEAEEGAEASLVYLRKNLLNLFLDQRRIDRKKSWILRLN